jgi:hypothetical protein
MIIDHVYLWKELLMYVYVCFLFCFIGHNGTAVLVDSDQLSPTEKVLYDVGWQKYAHNEYVSRQIPLRRVLPDVRDPE